MKNRLLKNILIGCLSLFFVQGQAQTFTNYTTADGLINNSVHCLTVDANSNLWFGTQEGISKFDGTTWTNYDQSTHPDLVSNTVFAIATDSEGNTWVGTDFGLNKFNDTNWTTYTEADGLADDRVKCIKEDLDGNIWIGNSDGVSVFDGTNWTSYTTSNGLPFGGVNYVEIDDNGDKWFGTGLGGVYFFDGTNFTTITEEEGLLNDKIRSIAIDNQANKWIGNTDGVSVFDANNELVTNHTIMYILPPPDTLNPVEDVKIDSEGRIWAGIYVDYLVTVGGVAMYDGTTWVDYDESDGLVGPVIRQLAIDADDNVWVATSTGISKISDVMTNTSSIETSTFNLYPNPTSNQFTIEWADLMARDLGKIEIYNSAMQVVKTVFTIQGQSQYNIATPNLAKGMYFVKIKEQVLKLVID